MRAKLLFHGGPLVRTKPKDLIDADIKRVPRVVGVRNGMPLLEDQRLLKVSNIIWCTGYQAGFSWIDLPIFAETNELPLQNRGITKEPGLYFVGLLFQYSASSSMVHGVARDAKYIVKNVVARTKRMKSTAKVENYISSH